MATPSSNVPSACGWHTRASRRESRPPIPFGTMGKYGEVSLITGRLVRSSIKWKGRAVWVDVDREDEIKRFDHLLLRMGDVMELVRAAREAEHCVVWTSPSHSNPCTCSQCIELRMALKPWEDQA